MPLAGSSGKGGWLWQPRIRKEAKEALLEEALLQALELRLQVLWPLKLALGGAGGGADVGRSGVSAGAGAATAAAGPATSAGTACGLHSEA